MKLRRNTGLKRQIGWIPIIALVGFLAILLMGYSSLSRMAQSNRTSVQTLDELTLLREIQRDVGAARIAEKQFLAARDEAELARHDAAIIAVRRQLDRLDENRHVVTLADIATISDLLDKYDSEFADMVNEATAIGLTENTGLRNEMRIAAHRIEGMIRPYTEALTVYLLQMRRHEKDFLIRMKPSYLRAWRVATNAFRAKMAETYLIPASVRDQVNAQLDKYVAAFEQVARHTNDLMVDQDSVDRTSGDILSLVNDLFSQSVLSVRKEASSALATSMYNARYLGLITIIVGAIVFMVARLVGSGITRPLVNMAQAMRSLALGELDVPIPAQDDRNEIGDMGRALAVFRDNETARRDAVRQLRRARNHMENLILSMREALIETDIQGRIVLANNAAEEMLAVRSGVLAGRRLCDLFVEHSVPSGADGRLIMLQSGVEHLYRNDRTAFSRILDTAPLPVLAVDDEARITRVNPVAAAALGHEAGDLIGQSVDILLPEDSRARHRTQLATFLSAPHPRAMGQDRALTVRRADGTCFDATIGLVPLRTGDGMTTICLMQRPGIDPRFDDIADTAFGRLFAALDTDSDVIRLLQGADRGAGALQHMRREGGEAFPVEYSGDLLRDDEGQVSGAIFVIRDISERVAAEKEIRKFKATLDATNDAIFMFRTDTLKFIYLNDEARRQTGWDDADYSERTPRDIMPIFEEARFRKLVAPLVRGDQPAVSIDTFSLAGNPIELKIELFDQGRPDERFVATLRDISDRVEAQNRIAQFKQILDQTKDMIYMFWPDSLRFFYGNQAALAFSDTTERGLCEKHVRDMTRGFDEAAFRTRYKPLIFGTTDALIYESVHVDGTGREVPVEVTLQVIEPNGEPPRFVAVVRDISERKAAENRIRLFKQVLDQSNDMIYMIDPASLRFLYVNHAVRRFWNRTLEEVVDHRIVDVIPDFDEAGFRELSAPLFSGEKEVVLYETTHRRPDGDIVPVEVALQLIAPSDGILRFVAIVRDVTERKAAEQAKREFISTISHELRTPLTSIKGSLDLITAGAVGKVDPKVGSLVTIARKNSDRLVRLINDILDMEKLEAGKMDMQFDEVELTAFLHEAVEANRAYGERLGVGLEFHDPGFPIPVRADRDRLMQIMANLLSNAAKFSNPGEKVEITAEVTGSKVRVSVSDTGAGIPEKAQATIFDKFTQADASDQRQKGGTGLGLGITKMMVEAHGGKIDFVSRVGEGTTFFFDLDLLQESGDTGGNTGGNTGGDTQADTGADARSDTRAEQDYADDLNLPHVLVCEDDQDIAQLLRMILENARFKVSVARTAAEAKEMISDNKFDAVTLDLGLPDKNGLTLLKELGRDPSLDHLPVVVVSATASKDKRRLQGAGVRVLDWIEKPIRDRQLVRILEDAVGQSGEQGAHILHVEDDPHIRQIVASIIGERARVCTAATVEEARFKLGKKRFDLVILDMSLPDGSGADLLPLMNAAPQKATPVLVFSAQEVTDEVVRHVNGVLVKSRASNEDLLHMIDSVVMQNARVVRRAAE